MFSWLAIIFIVLPIVEVIILIRVGKEIGFDGTLLLVVLTGLVGAWLAKHEGRRTLFKITEVLNAGKLPARELLDALMIFAAGIMLITPGLITDVFGMILLVPVTRAPVRWWVTRFFSKSFVGKTGRHFNFRFGGNSNQNFGSDWESRQEDSDDEIIDIEARDVTEPPAQISSGEKND